MTFPRPNLRRGQTAAFVATTRIHVAGRVPVGVAAMMLSVSAVAMLAGNARADCTPPGTPAIENVVCDAPGDALNFSAGGGDDTIDIISGTYTGTIQGSSGNDTINLDGAAADVNVIEGNADNDTINLLSGTVFDVLGGAGMDLIILDGADVTNAINGSSGNDTINLLSGTVFDALGGADDDMITLDGASIGNILSGGIGNDTIDLLSGTVTVNVRGELGNDIITLDGATITGNIEGEEGNDTINLLSGMVDNALGVEGADIITLDGATVTGNVEGGIGNDTIMLLGGTVFDALGGADNDMITLDGADVTNTINGSSGNDTIDLLSGTVAANVLGSLGTDTITLDGAIISGNINGGLDNDIILLLSGSSADVIGDFGNDTITLDGAVINNDIGANEGDDIIMLLSGAADDVRGDGGIDVITLNGAILSGNIEGGTEGDTIMLLGGSAVNVLGGAGNDAITLNGATLSGNLDGGVGDDIFSLTSGSFGGDLLGDDGSDLATILSTFDLSTITGNLDGGDDVSTADGFIDTLTIQSSGTLTGANVINWELINLDLAGGTLQLTGGSLVTSAEDGFGLFLNNSTLDLGGVYSITGDVQINAGSDLLTATLGGTGVFSISDDLRNFGAIDMSGAAPAPGDVLTVNGDYTGGGSLFLDADLDASLVADRLVLNGDISGVTVITINDTNPPGAATDTGTGPGAGFVLVDNSGGGSTIAAGDFVLAGGGVVKGPFTYTLSLEADDILYLQSGLLGQVSGYAVLTEVMRAEFPTLFDRLGDRRYNGFGDDGTPSIGLDNAGIWARIEGDRRDISGSSGSAGWEQSRGEAEVGLDIPMEIGGGVGVIGFAAHAVRTYATVSGIDETDVDATGFGAGLSFAWFPGGGFYADAQGRVTAWDTNVEVPASGVQQDVNGVGWGASLEVGNRIALGANTAVIPRGQVIYSDVNFSGFTDSNAVSVSQNDSASAVISGGVAVEMLFPDNGFSLFADASVSQDVLGDSSINASGITSASGLENTWGTFSFGASVDVADGTSAYVAADLSSALGANFGDSTGYGLSAGIRINF